MNDTERAAFDLLFALGFFAAGVALMRKARHAPKRGSRRGFMAVALLLLTCGVVLGCFGYVRWSLRDVSLYSGH